MKTNTLIAFCIFLKISLCYSQHEISGKIIDQSQTPLPFANIVLHQADNKDNIKGTISDDNGNYRFEHVSNGNYWLEVSVLGFKIQKSEVFSLSGKSIIKKLNFTLIEQTQVLDEVVVKVKKPVIRQTAEKLIVDLEKSEMVNDNLQDVMKKVPGIIMINGKISYAGQQGVRILINGKTTDYMDITALLRDFPADNISKVELIHQPGAEFEAEGSGPIVNIILKKM